MSGKKDVAAAAAPSKPRKKVDHLAYVSKILRRREKKRILRKMVDPVAYRKTKRLNMAAHYRHVEQARQRRQFLRAARNPWLFKEKGQKKRLRSTSIYPKVGKMGPKSKTMFFESLPLTRLSKKLGLPRYPVVSPSPHLRLRNTAQWLAAERKKSNILQKRKQEKRKRLLEKFNKKKVALLAKKTAGLEEEKTVKGEKRAKKVKSEKPAETIKTPSVKKPSTTKKTTRSLKLRKSITPGTILITLVPPNLGRRVIFLKQLPSGNLLCAGPRRINNAPLHRLSPKHVIATSTKIDISKVKLGKLREKQLFSQKKRTQAKSGKKVFFGEEKKAKTVVHVKPIKAATKAIDKQLLPIVKKVPYLAKYLHARFTLTQFSYPHLMKF